MAKLRTTEDQLAFLRTLRAADHSEQVISGLQQLLKQSRLHGIVVKSIAALAEKENARSLAPQLAELALSLTAADAAKRDPGCEAKIAILKTLLTWDDEAPADFYLQLSRYVQMTPTFGDPVDVAAEVRGLAALGISATRPEGAILRLVDLLADPQKITRSYAAIAIGNWRGPEALPLLRLQARRGDEDPEAFGEVLAALLRQDPREQLDFVAEFLDNPATLESAALALGQSRNSAALPHLTHAYPLRRRSPAATTLLMSISLLRSEDAITWLLKQLEPASEKESLQLLDALHIHHTDPKTLAKIESVVQSHPALLPAYNEIFK